MSKCSINTSRPGFSLIELLVVIFIIAVVIAIVVPALGAARNTAKKQETANLISSLQQASVQFQLDKRRAPGYFTAAEMGSTENGARGFSGMQNAMLDLAGGIVTGTPAGSVSVGPLSARPVQVDPTLIGAKLGSSSKAYFTPAAKFFKKQDGSEGGERAVGGFADHRAIPEVVDSWGMPILYWQLDTSALGQVTQPDEFARDSSGAANAPTIARYYWNSNRAILASTGAGFKRVDQSTASLLGSTSATPVQRSSTLTGILGSPGSPGAYTASTALAAIMPTAGRGSFVIHSAGSDGVYLGRGERGGTLVTSGSLHYGLNFRKPDNTPHTDSSGKQISIDLGGEFDDTILGGN